MTAPRNTKGRLRDLPSSPRHFWKEPLDQYVQQKARDVYHDKANDRDLPANEIMALALNEIAATQRKGYFYHLPHQNVWNKQAFDPKSRSPPMDLGASVPTLIYMPFVWTEQGCKGFFQSSHRTRYVASDFQLNPPPMQTPIYCFQVAANGRYPLYTTAHASYLILQATALYFGKLADLEAVIGRPPGGKARVKDSAVRLQTIPELWNKSQDLTERVEKLEKFKYTSLKAIYDAICDVCRVPVAASSFTAGDLWQIIPRPLHPEAGVALGTPLDYTETDEHRGCDPSGPPTRRDQRKDRSVQKRVGPKDGPAQKRAKHL